MNVTMADRSNESSDAELVRALVEGSGDALNELYRRHGALIYRFCLRLSQDQSIAEEVTQDTFLILLKEGARFDAGLASLSTWLCGIARRLVWTHLNRRQRSVSIEDQVEDRLESPDDDPGVALSRQQTVEAVRRGIEALPPDAREVIVLCEFEDMTYEEAAIVLGVPIGTVRSRLHRAKSRLARLLREPSR